ncbi:conserved hypothetical protein [uncultured Desulfobacterium sp.]|uniref:Uncharacterized protein n=1 Tax=uncultured Desulfobacterium sp. TaxID=201089 RepID=A0A445MUZ1_9BACT|nr:conserved hypothetical protein [uncultured Desulfobacterium sp.]
MKDERGAYYYPFPQNKRVRMYVQEEGDSVLFRLWNADDLQLWEDHGWIPYEAIKQAQEMYQRKNDFDPNQAYNLEIAKAVIKENKISF